MPRLAPSAYLDHLRRESARFGDVLAACDPAARVPSCPDWSAADLLAHLAGVQWFWARVVRHRPDDPDEAADPRFPEAYDALLAAYRDASADLDDALAAADPADPAWSWSAERTVAFTLRRQAHEALVHRLDAELAAGVPHAPVDPALAADGVDEALAVMFGGAPPFGSFEPRGGTVAVVCRDTGDEVRVQPGWFTGTHPEPGPDGEARVLDGDDLRVVPADGAPAATVTATAAELDAWLWRRSPGDGVVVEGDPEAYAAFRRAVDHPID